MSDKTLKTTIQFRRDTTENWVTNKDVVPAAGEPCFDKDTGVLKIGDGVATYENLPRVGGVSAAHYEGVKGDGESDTAVIERVLAAAGADVAVHGLGSAAYVDTDAFDAAGSKDEAIAAAKSAGDKAQTAVDALSGKVGTVTEGKTVVEMIQDAQAAATYDDKDIKSRMTTAEGKITTLIGEDASKSARAIAAEEVAKIVDGADSSYDTLKEIADWISGHKTDATAMNSAIIALEGIVDGIGVDGEKATVVAYVTDAIAALKIGDYAKAADLTALAGRVDTLEGTAHEHANKAVLDGITAEKNHRLGWQG